MKIHRNVLVTGGAGYIGSHTCKSLYRHGYRPITYDNLSSGHDWAVKWGPLEIGDILDCNRLNEIIETHEPIAIVHMAAHAYVGESVIEPGKYYRNNVAGSLNVIEAARDHSIKALVFSSSCATYGIPDKLPVSEYAKLSPVNPYGHTKAMVEQILHDFRAAHNLRSISLRYFNAAGADCEGEIGEAHLPETHLIPLAFQAASNADHSLTIFGIDYDTPDGTCIRDYVHVSDLADAHVKAVDQLLSGSHGDVFNLGLGRGYSVKEVINAVAKITGRTVPIKWGPRRNGDPAILVCEASKARRIFEWHPHYRDIETMVASAWSWHKKHHDLSA